jgi:hypothetical protein
MRDGGNERVASGIEGGCPDANRCGLWSVWRSMFSRGEISVAILRRMDPKGFRFLQAESRAARLCLHSVFTVIQCGRLTWAVLS